METQEPKNSGAAVAALYGHCESAYNALLTGAKTVVQEDGNTIVVWEGMLVNLIVAKLHLSTPYYTSITKALKRMDCIRQIKRGGGSGTSQWELIKAPTIEAFLHDQPIKIVEQSRYALQQTQLDALNKRVNKLEGFMKGLFEEEIAQIKSNLKPSELGDVNGE